MLLRAMIRFRLEHGPPAIVRKGLEPFRPPTAIAEGAGVDNKEDGEGAEGAGGAEAIKGDSEEWLRVMLRDGEIKYPFKACLVRSQAIIMPSNPLRLFIHLKYMTCMFSPFRLA